MKKRMNPEKILLILSQIREFRDCARQTWSQQGYNETFHNFREGLGFNGNIDHQIETHDVRFRVQARQAYVFAQAWLDTHDPHFFQRAILCAENMINLFRNTQGGYIYSLKSTGGISNAHCYTYEQAFAIFTFVHLGHITHDESYFSHAENTWDFLVSHLTHPQGGFYTSTAPDCTPHHEQNPHMHLLEACLYALLFTGNPVWLTRAQSLYKLFTDYFFDVQTDTVTETLEPNWERNALIQRSEPGHASEWIWLLHIYKQLTGEDTTLYIQKLYTSLLAHGINAQNQLAYDGLDGENIVAKNTHRLWCQTELLKAHLAVYESFVDTEAGNRALQLAQTIIEKYLIIETGTWHEQLTENGADTYAYSPASSLYHLNLAFQESFRILESALASVCTNCKGCKGDKCHAN